MVLQLGHSHSHRSPHFDISHAGTQVVATAKEAEVRSDGRVRAGWIVSLPLDTQIDVIYRILMMHSVLITSILRLQSLLVISNSSDPTCMFSHHSSQ